MINRLLIRIKTVQLAYACLQSQEKLYAAEKLTESVEATQKLYNFLLALIVKVTDYRRLQIETARNKFLPTDAELAPNTRFIDNQIARMISQRSEVLDYCAQEQVTSDFDTELYRSLLEDIQQTEAYQQYMDQAVTPTFDEDRALWIEMLNTVFAQSEKLSEVMEERDIYWNDDFTTVLKAVVKTLGKLKPGTEQLMPVKNFNTEEDRRFAIDLLKYSLEDYFDNVRLINTVAPNWEAERMALMDKVIMGCALAEIKHFPSIAVAISINEYIELAKHYCSPKSAHFINGVLDRIVKEWREDRVIIKA